MRVPAALYMDGSISQMWLQGQGASMIGSNLQEC